MKSLRQIQAAAWHGWRFVSRDMWRRSWSERGWLTRSGVATLRVVYLTVLAYIQEGIGALAGSLTFSTVLSLVPMLAVIIGIAKGFGLQDVVRQSLETTLPGHEVEFARVFSYVDNYLQQVQGGLFIGVGLLVLLYTVLMLVSTIENAFNQLWQAPHARAWSRRIINYLGAFILFPILLTVSSGTTIFLSTLRHTHLGDLGLLSTLTGQLLSLLPYVLIIATFTLVYLLIPNVRVRLMPALLAGVVAGLAFQIFQALYINGVLWISRYNAIYGSFAAVPLALLWIQLSWVIVLLGAEISYAIQHVWHFNAAPNELPLSRRSLDSVFILVMAHIASRYSTEGGGGYRAEQLSEVCNVSLRQTTYALQQLQQMGLVIEITTPGAEGEGIYLPSLSPEHLTLGLLIDRIDRWGSEPLDRPPGSELSRVWSLRLRGVERLGGRERLLRELVQS